ncbi:hypothetical protein LINPERHAP1_LOCUS28915 [Linum perenne]
MFSTADKWGIDPHPREIMEGFTDVISECGIGDIPLHGHQLTWEKFPGRPNLVKEILDRGMVNDVWLEINPEVKLN